MDGFDRHHAADIKEWWKTAPQLEPQALRDGVLDQLHTIHEASVDDDWDAVQQHIRLYELGESYCLDEPQLSTYEYGKMGIICTLAGNSISKGEYARAIEEIREVQRIYAARMERYEVQGIPPRRASEIKYNLLLRLADVKWIGPDSLRDALMTPEEVLGEIRETVEYILDYIKENPNVTNAKTLWQGLALCELVGLKMALRYCPDKVSELVRRFNANYSEDLALNPSHYDLVKAAEGDKSAYYWDFELAKLRMASDAPAKDVYMCIELRSLAARNTFGDWRIQGLLRGWRREALTIVRELQARES